MIGDVPDHDAGHGPKCHHKGQEAFKLQETPEPDVVRAMTTEMRRRGPDADDFFFNEVVALGPRRLAIIDLSDSGCQPMHDLVVFQRWC